LIPFPSCLLPTSSRPYPTQYLSHSTNRHRNNNRRLSDKLYN
jgi:hypothetical protein